MWENILWFEFEVCYKSFYKVRLQWDQQEGRRSRKLTVIEPENRVRNLSNPLVDVFITATSTLLLRSVGMHSLYLLGQTVFKRRSNAVIFAIHFLNPNFWLFFFRLVYKTNNRTGEMEKLGLLFSTILPFSWVLCYSRFSFDSLRSVIIFTFRFIVLKFNSLLFALISQHEKYSSLNFISTVFRFIHRLWLLFLSSADCCKSNRKKWEKKVGNYSHELEDLSWRRAWWSVLEIA